jgi:hypothetical protein
MVGDQIYADELSEAMKARIKPARDKMKAERILGSDDKENQLFSLEEFCVAYVESWSNPHLRWAMSCIPSLMIFDDHEIIDDWNISQQWLSEMQAKPWWGSKLRDGLLAYWLYQGAGNLAPSEWRLDQRMRIFMPSASAISRTGTGLLGSQFAGIAAGSRARFGYILDVGPVRIVVADCRSRRVLSPTQERAMMDDDEWRWLVKQCTSSLHPYLLVVFSLPAFMPSVAYAFGAIIEGMSLSFDPLAVAGLVERARQEADFEHWAPFPRSFLALTNLLRRLAGEGGQLSKKLVALLSGDVHFSYNMDVQSGLPTGRTTLLQLVSSPSRNLLEENQAKILHLIQALSSQPAAFNQVTWRPLLTSNGWLWFGDFIATIRLGAGGLRVYYERASLGQVPSTSGTTQDQRQPRLTPVASFHRQL